MTPPDDIVEIKFSVDMDEQAGIVITQFLDTIMLFFTAIDGTVSPMFVTKDECRRLSEAFASYV